MQRVSFRFLFILILASVGFLILWPAQTIAISDSNISISMVPKSPNPNENITINLISYAIDLNGVSIQWLVDGKTVASEVGKKSILLKAPAAGAETRVVARLATTSGIIEKNLTIKPNTSALLWQAMDSYVPPFYKGKALPTANSQIKVVAMPEIKLGNSFLNPKNLLYSWKIDYVNSINDSGYGKNFLVFYNDYLENSNNVGVKISSIDQSASVETSVDIGVFEPKILFYLSDPERGTFWHQTIENGHKVGGEEIIEAIPYFISPKNIRAASFLWDWFINGKPVQNFNTYSNQLPIRTEIGTTGTSKIKLQLNNEYKLYRGIEKEINIQY